MKHIDPYKPIPLNISVDCVRCGNEYTTAAEGTDTDRDACPRTDCVAARALPKVSE